MGVVMLGEGDMEGNMERDTEWDMEGDMEGDMPGRPQSIFYQSERRCESSNCTDAVLHKFEHATIFV